MVNSFYFNSNALNYVLGYFLLFEKNVVIISPWLADLEIKLPINSAIKEPSIRLSNIIHLTKDNVLAIIVSPDSYNDYFLNHLPKGVNLLQIKDLHAKTIVSDELVYIGSANITRRGTTTNTELCQLSQNEFRSSKKFIEERLRIRI